MRLDLRSPAAARFAAVGVLTAGLYFAALLVLRALGAPLPLAGAGAYLVAVPANYLMHKLWTFRCTQPHGRSLPRYLVSFAWGFALNAGLLALPPRGD